MTLMIVIAGIVSVILIGVAALVIGVLLAAGILEKRRDNDERHRKR